MSTDNTAGPKSSDTESIAKAGSLRRLVWCFLDDCARIAMWVFAYFALNLWLSVESAWKWIYIEGALFAAGIVIGMPIWRVYMLLKPNED